MTNITESTNYNKKSYYLKVIDLIIPLKLKELPKFLLITALMFCILSIQNLIRAMKDSIVNTMIGTETISFLKFWGVMPSAFLFTVIYIKLINKMRAENIFYLIVSCFLIFFSLFAFILFPNYQSFHLNPDRVGELVSYYPNYRWIIMLLSNWSFSLFYIIAELWPNAVFALLFWQFVNRVTNIEESKRFYPLFALLGQTGLIICGKFLENLKIINEFIASKLTNVDIHSLTIQIVLSVVIILGLMSLAIFWFLNNVIFTKQVVKFKAKKSAMGLTQSIKMICSSRYIMLIAVMLIAYGIAINLVEGPWKAEVAKTYKNPTEFAIFVGSYLSYTGMFTIFFTILGSNIVRHIGWLAAAIITPLIVLLTGLGFFSILNFNLSVFAAVSSIILTDPILMAINIGAMQNVLSKSTKYTLFDSTKEMAYVPLDDELKTKGKAAVDVIGVKLGKSISAFLQVIIFSIIPSANYQSISVYLMIVFTIVCAVWLIATLELNKEYRKIT